MNDETLRDAIVRALAGGPLAGSSDLAAALDRHMLDLYATIAANSEAYSVLVRQLRLELEAHKAAPSPGLGPEHSHSYPAAAHERADRNGLASFKANRIVADLAARDSSGFRLDIAMSQGRYTEAERAEYLRLLGFPLSTYLRMLDLNE